MSKDNLKPMTTDVVITFYPVSVKPKVASVLVSYRFGVSEGKYYNGKFIKHLDDPTSEFPDVEMWAEMPDKPEFHDYDPRDENERA